MKIATIVGARPQFIKAAMVSRALSSHPDLREILIHTGQHYDANMSEIFFSQLDVPAPNFNLGIGSGKHGFQTGRMLEKLEEALLTVQPDWTIVYGDTNSTLAGALVSAKLHIPIAHVEAGLRSFNRKMPEEINRVLTDHASDLLFAPTKTAVANLRQEGIDEHRIVLTGDVMFDAALYYAEKADRESYIMETIGINTNGYILATIHRAENTDRPSKLRTIVEGLNTIAREIPVVIPLHPRTAKALEHLEMPNQLIDQLVIIGPVGYLDMVMLEKHAKLIITDSGGVQKEAFFHKVKCVTVRAETEWIELVNAGWNTLVTPDSAEQINKSVMEALNSPPAAEVRPYGDGDSAKKIVDRILSIGSKA